MTPDKPYKTYNQQMKYLRDSKGIYCNGSSDKKILIKNGYFNLVNGYKIPFVIGKDLNGNHRYIGGTSIEHLLSVKTFDEEIRYILLKHLTHCEEEIRALAAHKFDYENGKGQLKWYSIEAYNPSIKAQDKIKVIARCYNEIDQSKQPYVKHYLDEYSSIPTWVFIKIIKFSTFIDFLKICKPSILNSICQLYSVTDSKGNSDPELLISILHWMRKVRNSCAHNERVFDIHRNNSRVNQPFIKFLNNPSSYTNNRSQRIFDLIIYLRYFLEDMEYSTLIGSIQEAFNKLKLQLNPNAFDKVRAETGIKDLIILEELSNKSKNIEYNRLETF